MDLKEMQKIRANNLKIISEEKAHVALMCFPAIKDVVEQYKASNKKKIDKRFFNECKGILNAIGYDFSGSIEGNRLRICFRYMESRPTGQKRIPEYPFNNDLAYYTYADSDYYLNDSFDLPEKGIPIYDNILSEIERFQAYLEEGLKFMRRVDFDKIIAEHEEMRQKIEGFNKTLHHSFSHLFRL